MRQGHVASAQRVERAQNAERIVDGMPALDADERGDLAPLADAQDVLDRIGHLESVRILLDHAVDDVDLFERLAYRGALFAG